MLRRCSDRIAPRVAATISPAAPPLSRTAWLLLLGACSLLTVFLLLAAPRPAAADPGERLVPVVRPQIATADELYGVVPVGHRNLPPLRVRVWTDRGQEGLYYPGERVHIRFTTNDDAYVCIYDIDTRGQLRVLFPAPGDAGFVHAHEVVTLPGPYADFDYMVTGPPGIETIEAIASRAQLASWEETWENPGDWWEEDDYYDPEYDYDDDYDEEDEYWDDEVGWDEWDEDDRTQGTWGRGHGYGERPIAAPRATGILVSGDPFVAVHRVNRRLLYHGQRDGRDYDTGYASFYVGRRVSYPRYACNDCHGPYHAYDPYGDHCSVFSVRVNLGWVYRPHHVHVSHTHRLIRPRYIYVRHRNVPRAYKHLKREWPSHHRRTLKKQFYGTPAWKAIPKRGVHPSTPPARWKKQDGHRPKVEQPYPRPGKSRAPGGRIQEKGAGAVKHQYSNPEKPRLAAGPAAAGKSKSQDGAGEKRGGKSASQAKDLKATGKKQGGKSASQAKDLKATGKKRGGKSASKAKDLKATGKKQGGKSASQAKDLKATGKKQGGKSASQAKSRSGASK